MYFSFYFSNKDFPYLTFAENDYFYLFQRLNCIGGTGSVKDKMTSRCDNSLFKWYSTIFPVVRRALQTTIQYQDPVLILIPDMDIIELQTFLLHLREHHSMMNISKDLKDLLQVQLETAVKEEVCLFEDLADIGNYYDRDTNIKSDSKIPCEHCGTLWNTKNFRKDKSFRRPHE